MTFQFEDDSALEELLNQQLDRNKRFIPQSANKSAFIRSDDKTNQSVNDDKPSSSSIKGNVPTSRTKLSDWLFQKSTGKVDEDELQSLDEVEDESKIDTINEVIKKKSFRGPNERDLAPENRVEPRHVTNPKDSRSQIDEQDEIDTDYGNENFLQKQSKQKLIHIIIDELMPKLDRDKRRLDEHTKMKEELVQLRIAYDKELENKQLDERRHDDKLRIAETTWNQLNKQLEHRLEISQSELKDTIMRYDNMIKSFEEQYKQQISFICQNYELRLTDQKNQFETDNKRRQTIHDIELNSRLKIQGNMDKLETAFDCWQLTIESTIKQLEEHFKSVEIVLDKQTSTIKNTNDELINKTQVSINLANNIDGHMHDFKELGTSIKGLLNDLTSKVSVLEKSQAIVHESDNQIQILTSLTNELHTKLLAIIEQQRLLDEQKLEFQLNLQKVEFDSNNLDKLKSQLDDSKEKLNERENDIAQAEHELKKGRLELDLERTQLDQSRQDLDRLRKEIGIKEKELERWQVNIGHDMKTLRKNSSRLNQDSHKLTILRDAAQKEFAQLRRLQRSLVCSICLSRLCDGKANQVSNMKTSYFDPITRKSASMHIDFKDLLDKIQTEEHRLEKESRYIQLLQTKTT